MAEMTAEIHPVRTSSSSEPVQGNQEPKNFIQFPQVFDDTNPEEYRLSNTIMGADLSVRADVVRMHETYFPLKDGISVMRGVVAICAVIEPVPGNTSSLETESNFSMESLKQDTQNGIVRQLPVMAVAAGKHLPSSVIEGMLNNPALADSPLMSFFESVIERSVVVGDLPFFSGDPQSEPHGITLISPDKPGQQRIAGLVWDEEVRRIKVLDIDTEDNIADINEGKKRLVGWIGVGYDSSVTISGPNAIWGAASNMPAMHIITHAPLEQCNLSPRVINSVKRQFMGVTEGQPKPESVPPPLKLDEPPVFEPFDPPFPSARSRPPIRFVAKDSDIAGRIGGQYG